MRHWQTCFLKSEGQLKTMLFGISQLINQFHTPPPCIFEKILQIILLFIGLWSADNETVRWNFSTAWWRNFKKIPRIIEAEKFVKFPLHSKILRLEIDFFDTCRKKKWQKKLISIDEFESIINRVSKERLEPILRILPLSLPSVLLLIDDPYRPRYLVHDYRKIFWVRKIIQKWRREHIGFSQLKMTQTKLFVQSRSKRVRRFWLINNCIRRYASC